MQGSGSIVKGPSDSKEKYVAPSLRKKEVPEKGKQETVGLKPSAGSLNVKKKELEGEEVFAAENTTGRDRGHRGKAKLPLLEVQMYARAYSTILQHCMENYPSPVNGQLLGSEQSSAGGESAILEITSSFGLPPKKYIYAQVMREKASSAASTGVWPSEKEIEARIEEEYEHYQEKMSELYYDLRCDYFTVGYYQTTTPGMILDKETFETLAAYQESMGNAVLIIFDHLALQMGQLPLKAFKINTPLFKSLLEKDALLDGIPNDPDPNNSNRRIKNTPVPDYSTAKDRESLLIQIPINIKTTFYEKCFSHTWFNQSPHISCNNLPNNSFWSHSHNENSPISNHDFFQMLPPYAQTLGNLFIDADSTLGATVKDLHSCLDKLADDNDYFHKYIKWRYRKLLVQRHVKERKRIEDERRRLRGEEVTPADEWTPNIDSELVEEFKNYKKVDAPSSVGLSLLGGEVSRREEEMRDICSRGVAAVALAHSLIQD